MDSEKQTGEMEGIDVAVLFASPLWTQKGFDQLEWQVERDVMRGVDLKHGLKSRFRFRFDVATLDNLFHAVIRGCKVLHFIGHGLEKRQSLIFEDRDGKPMVVKAADLKRCIRNAIADEGEDSPIRVAVVGSCFSEVVGLQLSEAGVKHVVAYKQDEEMLDVAGQCFTKQFYYSLGMGYSVEKAYLLAKQLASMNYGPRGRDLGFVLLPDGSDHSEVVFVPHGEGVSYRPQEEDPISDLLTQLALPRPFHPRGDALLAIKALLSPQRDRLAMVYGAGGVGKSVMAVMVALWSAERRWFAGGVQYLDVGGRGLEEAVSAVVVPPLPMLIVLDNCDPLRKKNVEFLRTVLHSHADVRILLTAQNRHESVLNRYELKGMKESETLHLFAMHLSQALGSGIGCTIHQEVFSLVNAGPRVRFFDQLAGNPRRIYEAAVVFAELSSPLFGDLFLNVLEARLGEGGDSVDQQKIVVMSSAEIVVGDSVAVVSEGAGSGSGVGGTSSYPDCAVRPLPIFVIVSNVGARAVVKRILPDIRDVGQGHIGPLSLCYKPFAESQHPSDSQQELYFDDVIPKSSPSLVIWLGGCTVNMDEGEEEPTVVVAEQAKAVKGGVVCSYTPASDWLEWLQINHDSCTFATVLSYRRRGFWMAKEDRNQYPGLDSVRAVDVMTAAFLRGCQAKGVKGVAILAGRKERPEEKEESIEPAVEYVRRLVQMLETA